MTHAMSPTAVRRFLLIAIAVIAAFIVPFLTVPQASAHVEEDVNSDTVLAFVINDTTGQPSFDMDAAHAAGADAETLASGAAFNDLVADFHGVPANDRIQTMAFSLPLWGNWCGPGHGSGEPTDTLDALCMEHDQCYEREGYLDCECDEALRAGIDREFSAMTWDEQAMARAVHAYFSLGFCNPF